MVNRNKPAIELIKKEIKRLEAKLEKLMAVINYDYNTDYTALTASVLAKGLERKAGNLSVNDYMAFLDKAAKKEAEILAKIDPIVSNKNRENRIKLEVEISSLKRSLYSLGDNVFNERMNSLL